MALPIAQAVPLPRAQSSRKLNAAIQVQVISNKMSILYCHLLQGDQSTGCPLNTQINMNLCSKLTPLKMVQNILGKATPPPHSPPPPPPLFGPCAEERVFSMGGLS